MKHKSEIAKLAKGLYKLSVTPEGIDQNRVALIVKTLVDQKPLHYIKILEHYKKLLEKHIASAQIIVEVPKGFSHARSHLARLGKEVVVRENGDIISGVRVINGDWVFDNTLNGKLESIVGQV